MNAPTMTLEDGIFCSLSLLRLCVSTFFTCAASFLCCLYNCQTFIKQLGEGVSFPWSSCQLFPVSPAPWKSLKATNFLGLGLSLGLELGLGYRLCVQNRGLKGAWAKETLWLSSHLAWTQSSRQLTATHSNTHRNPLGSVYMWSLFHHLTL